MTEHLFVYGTLQDAGVRAELLGTDRARVVARGTVRGMLYHLGEYPGLVASDEDARVPGLIVELSADALARLDRYEGTDEGLYGRERVAVACDDGVQREAWVYRYLRSIAGKRRIAAWPA
ncbi:MAG: gamma-glutamylcyclotransferase family protein [Deltaproteobacteria bacterium]|nr:gamma-glutamylcyclotransferase family protein [Deltaproteobacteria bacterium]